MPQSLRPRWLGGKQDDDGQTALHYLAGTSNAREAFVIALRYGMSPDAQGEGKRKPLMYYAKEGLDPEIMHLLLDASGDPCHAADEGQTALAYARDNPAFTPRTSSGEEATPIDRLSARCPGR